MPTVSEYLDSIIQQADDLRETLQYRVYIPAWMLDAIVSMDATLDDLLDALDEGTEASEATSEHNKNV